MKGRFLRGAIAGMVAGLWILSVDYGSSLLLHFSRPRWFDALSQLLFDHQVVTGIDLVLVLLAQLILFTGLGCLFSR